MLNIRSRELNLICVLFLTFCLLSATAPAAILRTFDVAWSGASFGNSAVATGQITIDTTLLPNPGSASSPNWVSSFSIKVSGASSGNGVWSKVSFGMLGFHTGSTALDFSRELVGQNGWGTVFNGATDFLLSSPLNLAPKNTSFFTIQTNGGTGEKLRLTSFKPEVANAGLGVGAEFSDAQGRGVNERVYALREDSHGRILVGGLFSSAGGVASKGIARFLPIGTRDETFDVGSGISGGTYTYVTDIAVLPNDAVVAVGDFAGYNGRTRGNLVQVNGQGVIDASFASGAGADGRIRCIERLPDGKFLIGGQFSHYDGVACPGLARLLADGTLDPSFNVGTGFGAAGEYVDQIELLAGGNFLIAGQFKIYDGHSTLHVARLLATGRVDVSFQATQTFVNYMETLRLCSGGRILVGGSGYGQKLFRLQANGALDTGFNPAITGSGIYGVHEMPDGKVLVGGEISSSPQGFSNLVMLKADGSLSTDSFLSPVNPNQWVGPILGVSGGRIFIGGAFSSIGSVNYGRMAKLINIGPTVSFQSSTATMVEGVSKQFSISISSTLAQEARLDFSVEADDPAILSTLRPTSSVFIYPGLQTTQVSVFSTNDVVLNGPRTFRLRMASPSPSVIVGAPEFITVTLQDDDVAGTVFLENATGVLHEGQGGLPVKIKRYINDPGTRSVRLRSTDGTALAGRDYHTVDTAVNFPAGVYEQTVIIGGPAVFPEANPVRSFTVELYDPSPGAILGTHKTCTVEVNDRDDPGSSVIAYTVPDPSVLVRVVDLALDADGVLYGLALYSLGQPSAFESRILKFSSSGIGSVLAVIPTGGMYLWMQAMDIGPDGKIYVGGRVVLRYYRDGTPDTNWINPISGSHSIRSLLCLPDGKVMIAGNITQSIGGYTRKQVVRLLSNGAVDPTFDLGTILPAGWTDWIYDLAVDATGKLLISGKISSIQGVPRTNVARLLPDGGLDASFDASVAIASQVSTLYVNRITPSPDGKIYLVAAGKTIRVHSNGSLDSSFPVIGGSSFSMSDVAVQPDGKIIASDTDTKRFDSNGAPDLGFTPYGPAVGNISDILLGPDGRIHLIGQFSKVDGQLSPCIATLLGGPGSAAGTIGWDPAPSAVGEGIGRASVLLRRNSNLGTVGINYTLVPETAGVGTDVAALSGYHEFAPGETGHLVEFDVLDDAAAEDVESLRLVLHDPFGGALIGPETNSPFTIIDDDGPGIGDWLARHFPRSPLDPFLLSADPDQDGMNTFAEWMSNSDPSSPMGAKHPKVSWPFAGSRAFGISFYLDPAKTGFRTVVERSTSLMSNTWSIIWDSNADPLRQSILIAERPLDGAGWMTVSSPDSIGTTEFLRVRFER